MKVIDLLVKIANGKEIPEKIKYKDYIYWYDKDWKDYQNAQVEFRSYLVSCRYHTTDFLNEEVEIIEDKPIENKKIEKIKLTNGGITLHKKIDGIENDIPVGTVERTIIYTINEIIDKINVEK